jgi:hypothetical protein
MQHMREPCNLQNIFLEIAGQLPMQCRADVPDTLL